MIPLRNGVLFPAVFVLMAGAAAWLTSAMRTQDVPVAAYGQAGDTALQSADGPGLCPWRQPQEDMQIFFPGADRYETRTLFLEGLRLPILQRLGPGDKLDSNVLYIYPVRQKQVRRGEVLVGRTAGEYGAIEVVVGVDQEGRVLGFHLQRYREPPQTVRILLSSRWSHSFRGKTADSAWRLGQDIPDVPAAAKVSATAVVRAVRALLIEASVAEQRIGPGK